MQFRVLRDPLTQYLADIIAHGWSTPLAYHYFSRNLISNYIIDAPLTLIQF